MFFLMGIASKRKNLNYNEVVVCEHCGKYGRYMVYMTYTVLSLFFIPCFRWNRKYYAQSSCCNRVWRLNKEVGRRIERGEQVSLIPGDLEEEIGSGFRPGSEAEQDEDSADLPLVEVKYCENCGYRTEDDFEYCPKCGKKL